MLPIFTLLTLALAQSNSNSPECVAAGNADQAKLDTPCNLATCSDACNNAITRGTDIESAWKTFSICSPTSFETTVFLATMKKSIADHNSECGTTIPFTLTYKLLAAKAAEKAAAGISPTDVPAGPVVVVPPVIITAPVPAPVVAVPSPVEVVAGNSTAGSSSMTNGALLTILLGIFRFM